MTFDSTALSYDLLHHYPLRSYFRSISQRRNYKLNNFLLPRLYSLYHWNFSQQCAAQTTAPSFEQESTDQRSPHGIQTTYLQENYVEIVAHGMPSSHSWTQLRGCLQFT